MMASSSTSSATFSGKPNENNNHGVEQLSRMEWLTRLKNHHKAMKHTDDYFMFGKGYRGPMNRPTITWKSSAPPRDDHDIPSWLTATEFKDSEAVLTAKVKQLANLIQQSKKTVLYTGAGISAQVIGQAAKSGTNVVGFKAGKIEAMPTLTHHALAVLNKNGYVHSWQQQNHDGLPQKAGYAQHQLNEIHGAWFDPSNPVVKYSGSLRNDCYKWMVNDAETADLVIVLGTSLSGLNADQVAEEPALRSMTGTALGTVCINLQQTQLDGKMTLRIFEKSDLVLQMLVNELGLSQQLPADIVKKRITFAKKTCVLVPYDKNGELLKDPHSSSTPWMVLDLSNGAKIKLHAKHNCQGARQPAFMHIGAKKNVKLKNGSVRIARSGNGVVVRRDDASSSFVLSIENTNMKIGQWWIDSAVAGNVPRLPVVNINPSFHPRGTALSSTKNTNNTKTSDALPMIKPTASPKHSSVSSPRR